MYDSIIIGCGFAGAVVARELAEKRENTYSSLIPGITSGETVMTAMMSTVY